MGVVEKEIKDSNSVFYYPKLLSRFEAFDSTFTLDEYRMLYFGFVFNENYSVFMDDKSAEIQTQIDSGNYAEANRLCDSILAKVPILLRVNYLKGYCLYSQNKNDSLIQKYGNRYYSLIEAIISTGDGKECKSGYKVIFIADEYEIIYKYLDIEEFKGQYLSRPCDILEVKPSKKFKSKMVYFDADEILKKEAEMFDLK